ncbi:hypothetical protein GCM10011514_54630 [Emticicia aquatilis]|uniref:Uncharacterized protein n=1 Tax=Emticicia aquatilis TaxID=1537369 RepID=A0A917DZJ0_9BACT|nr:hypothetical protein [Emticicia aquatilis]GGD83651.1 hypothetical protein GCM10011514_54630 [Emticicia aquatilis]
MNKRKGYWLIVLLIGVHFKSFSQLDSQKSIRNLIYLEAFGAGGYGSLNYERIIFQQKQKLPPNLKVGFRLGISTFHLKDFNNKFNPDVIIPVSVNAIYGKIHHVEIGFGQTISNVTQTSASFEIERKTTLNSNFIAGYRYQKSERGVIFRLNYSPIISSNKVYNSWFGLSIGYGF